MFPSRLGQSHLVRFPFDKVPQKKKKKKERGNGIFEISKNQDTQVICKHYAVGWPAQSWGEQNGNEPLLLHKPRDCESFPFHLKETERAAMQAQRIERRVAKC